MSKNLTPAKPAAEILERVIISGDLSKLSAQERVEYYSKVCQSLGINPLTRPFDYLVLNNKMILYATRAATEQLRSLRGISITEIRNQKIDDIYVVTAAACDKDGRTDTSTGAVNVKGASGEALANLFMKAETKAKRRVTLSLAGLGFLDESEISKEIGAQMVTVRDDGTIVDPEKENERVRMTIYFNEITNAKTLTELKTKYGSAYIKEKRNGNAQALGRLEEKYKEKKEEMENKNAPIPELENEEMISRMNDTIFAEDENAPI
jgi:hypothetical protein